MNHWSRSAGRAICGPTRALGIREASESPHFYKRPRAWEVRRMIVTRILIGD